MVAKISPEQADILLAVKNLSVEYLTLSGPVQAANNISFTLGRGQILGVVGESGSGKSTLAYAIARLHRPPAVITGGEVLYYGHTETLTTSEIPGNGDGEEHTGPVDILTFTPRQLRAFRWSELAIVFQSAMNALNPVMTIEKQIIDVMKAHNPTQGRDSLRRRAIDLLRLVGISKDRLRSYPHELSGGMRQRTTIAIALALNPDIIIMDEPTTALDVVVQRDILKQIMALRKEFGFSVIFITHDLSLLLEMADSLIIMYAGRIVEIAERKNLYANPMHPYTHGLLNSFPSLRGTRRTMKGIPGSPPDLRHVPSGCPFRTRCSFAFEACSQSMPPFYTPREEQQNHQVACFLHDRKLYPDGPPEQFARPEVNAIRAKSDMINGQQHTQPIKGGVQP